MQSSIFARCLVEVFGVNVARLSQEVQSWSFVPTRARLLSIQRANTSPPSTGPAPAEPSTKRPAND